MDRFIARPIVVAMIFVAPLAASNITVDTTSDAVAVDGFYSLREAIAAANGDVASNECLAGTGTSDRILFDLTLPATITLGSDLPEISESVAIVGPGIDDLTVDGVDAHSLLSLYEPTDVDPWLVVSGLTLTNGLGNPLLDGGGAILARGSLDLREVELSSSECDGSGGGVNLYGAGRIERSRILGNTAAAVPGGGGIYVSGQPGALELIDSTVAGNIATHEASGGGGIKSQEASSLVVRRSTISANSTGTSGGGIEAAPGFFDATTYYVEIESSTITLNECNVVNTANFGCGGGVRFAAGISSTLDATIRNSVIAQNLDAFGALLNHDIVVPFDTGMVFDSGGFNLIGDHSGSLDAFPDGAPNTNGDFVGTFASPIDPQLTALGDNGGPTPTQLFVPLNPHPLVDQGNCAGEAADQRGYGNSGTGSRLIDVGPLVNNPNGGDGCDIGAVEAFGVALTPAAIFADGFVRGRFLFWSSDVP